MINSNDKLKKKGVSAVGDLNRCKRVPRGFGLGWIRREGGVNAAYTH